MSGRKALALVLVLALTGSALALQQQRLYLQTGLETENVLSIQQHATFVEMVVEQRPRPNLFITEYGAVIGLVKQCAEVKNTFDNAVLWFNDQFLFGSKLGPEAYNRTPSHLMGVNPQRNISTADLLDDNRNNGTGYYDQTTGDFKPDVTGGGHNEGGNPDRDGFIRAQDRQERWGGCGIPDGFLHAVPTGALSSARGALEQDVDGACRGCVFTYEGTFFITDPNNHRWIVDVNTWNGNAMYTVHLQTDPWNPDRQGFPDEAIWAYREDGRIRVGMPYSEDPEHEICHDQATVAGEERYADDYEHNRARASAYEYDNTTTNGGASSWREHRRGPVGNTVECSIEYNFLVAVSFEDFGGAGSLNHGDGQSDDSDQAWRGNSHPHNPTECYRGAPPNTSSGPCRSGPHHRHNAVDMDLFFSRQAPVFVMDNPYWDHANRTDGIQTSGTPPEWDKTCATSPGKPPGDYRRQAIEAREPLVCDPDAMDGYHLHDGSQTVPP